MGTPNVTIKKQDGNTGVVRPGAAGVLAILAASQSLPQNVPATFNRPQDAVGQAGLGPLSEYGCSFLQNAQNPALLLAPSTSVAPTIYGQGRVWGGASVPTFGGTPVDEYHPIVTFTVGGTVGVAGIFYTVSLDGGQNTSAPIALGTATVITLLAPVVNLSTGLTLSLTSASIQPGDVTYCFTTRPQMNGSDLTTALEALRISRAPWDNMLIDLDVAAANVSTVDAWLAALEAKGVFKMAWMNTRHKNRPVPTTESESAYAAYLGTLLASTSSIRVDVGADGAEMPSPITGCMQPRPTSLFIATRAESNPVGVDPAFIALGPIPGGPTLTDTVGNPRWHDEYLYPGLDALRLSTLRSMPSEQGVFITNANLLSPNGSDYVYDQHARVMNVACTIAFALLSGQLSRGVRKQPPDKLTGLIYILEQDAQAIEANINAAFRAQLKGQCNASLFALSRTDDLSPNSGATVSGEVQVEALAYIKNFAITAKFVKAITVPTA